MTSEKIDLSKLEEMLEQERTCLLEGDLEGLAALLPDKEQLMDVLLHDPEISRDAIAPFEAHLQRNQLLLDGALQGIRTVATRLAALRQVRTALDTYDAQGRKQRVVTHTDQKLERRA